MFEAATDVGRPGFLPIFRRIDTAPTREKRRGGQICAKRFFASPSASGTDRKTAAFFMDVITDIALREVKKNGEFTFPGIGKLVKQERDDQYCGRAEFEITKGCVSFPG